MKRKYFSDNDFKDICGSYTYFNHNDVEGFNLSVY